MTKIILFEHQKKAVDNFSDKNQILAHEMGLGKTLTSAHIGKGDKNLVVCPAKLKQSWVEELHLIDETDIQVIETAKDEIKDKSWTIVSYDIVISIYQKLIDKDYDHLFLDESHYIKGKFNYSKRLKKMSGTKRAGASVLLAQSARHVILTTGTPIMNKPIELWNQLLAIDAPITREMSRTTFSKIYCGGHLKNMGKFRFWWEDGATRLDELREKIKHDVDIVRKSEATDLPPKMINRKIIQFNQIEQKEYDKAWDEYVAFIEQHPEYSLDKIKNIVDAQQLVEVQKLSQLTSLAKMKAVVEDLDSLEPGERVVIFAEYVKTIDQLNKALKKKKISYSTLKEKGSVEKFKKGKVQVFTSNIVAGGTGLNLQKDCNLLWIIDENWTPAINQQAEDRIHRLGQQGTAWITYYEVYGTVDERRKEINIDKKKIIKKLMNPETD